MFAEIDVTRRGGLGARPASHRQRPV